MTVSQSLFVIVVGQDRRTVIVHAYKGLCIKQYIPTPGPRREERIDLVVHSSDRRHVTLNSLQALDSI